MSEQVETIGSGPPELLDAMLTYVRRRGRRAERVTSYRERSYNIGYCETCSEMVSEVRIFYVESDGTEAHHQVEYQGLAELIRELTNDPEQVRTWGEAAVHESADERWDRAGVHGFDEEPTE